MQPPPNWILRVSCMLMVISIAGCQSSQTSDSVGMKDGVNAGHVFDIRSFGAIDDGQTLNTAAFAKAVAACERAGGGTIEVPAGRYLSGAIELKSHMRLCLDPGAALVASQHVSDYPHTEYPWDSNDKWISSLIYAHDAQDLTVCGRGTIDGQGASWWAPILAAKKKHASTTRSTTQPTGATTQPDPFAPHSRPQLIRFLRCSNVAVEGITLLNAPEWNIHPMFCDRVRVDGIAITAHVPSPNTDGINPESCRTVQISNCRIDNGDDCITLKSGADEAGRRIDRPDEDITITNCVTYNGHGGVTVGSEMSGGVRNVVVSNCVFHGTDTGIRIKSQRGRGGVVEGICFNNIVMQDVAHPIIITTYYMGKDKPGDLYPVNEGTPRFRDISISNIIAHGATSIGNISGLRELPISNIVFDNVQVQSKTGFVCANAAGVRFRDCVFNVADGAPFTTHDCTNVESDGIRSRVSDPIPSTK